MDKKYQVFISSTFLDMKEERQAAVEAILDAGHIPAGMELFAASDKSQWEVIKRWIDESDVFMIILGGRYGTVETESGKSYIQLEYEYAAEIKKPLFALYLTDEALQNKVRGPLGIDAIERQFTEKYEAFKVVVKSRMCGEVKSVSDVHIGVPKAINRLAKDYNLRGWVRADDNALSSVRASADPLIEMSTGPSPPYNVTEYRSGQNQNFARVGIRNAGGKPLSNCKVYIERIHPPLNDSNSTYLLDGAGFQLRHDDPEKIIDVAAIWESADNFKFSTPIGGGFFDTSVYMKIGERRTFTIKVVATECERTGLFSISADESKNLHLEFIEYVP